MLTVLSSATWTGAAAGGSAGGSAGEGKFDWAGMFDTLSAFEIALQKKVPCRRLSAASARCTHREPHIPGTFAPTRTRSID